MPILKDAKREIFCQVLVQTNKRTKAALAYGSTKTSARNQACRLMKEPDIIARVEELRKAQFQALQMETDEILGRLAAQARGDLRMLYDDDGKLRPINDLSMEEAACLQEVIETTTPGGKDANGNRLPDIVTRKIKLRDPTAALRMLAQHKRLIGSEADEALSNIAEAFAQRMADARQRRAGTK